MTSLFGFREIDEQCLCTFFAAESRPSFWYNSYGQEWYTTPPASFGVPGSSVAANQSSSTSSYSSEVSEVSETEPSVKTRWSRPEVLQLLSVFSAKRQRFKDINVKNKTVWEEISTALNKNGVSCTAKMCETKIKNLKRSYVSCVDHNKKSGSGKMRKCVYYDELQDIYSKDDAIEPQALCSNVDGAVIKGGKCMQNLQESSELSLTNQDEEEDTPPPKKKKPAAQRKKDDLVDLFKEFTEDRKEEEKERARRLSDMHRERMDFMNRFLSVFEKTTQNK